MPYIEKLEPNALRQHRQAYYARAVGGSALRSQGAPGMVAVAREFLSNIDLDNLCSPARFVNELNARTAELAGQFPGNGRGNWGAARKSLNIFLSACSRDREFSKTHQIDSIVHLLELPLDSFAVKFLIAQTKDPASQASLEKFQNIKSLTSIVSDSIQAIAQNIAERIGCLRHDLDYIAWTTRDE